MSRRGEIVGAWRLWASGSGPEVVFAVEGVRIGEVVERVGRGRKDVSSGEDAGEPEHLVVLGVQRAGQRCLSRSLQSCGV